MTENAWTTSFDLPLKTVSALNTRESWPRRLRRVRSERRVVAAVWCTDPSRSVLTERLLRGKLRLARAVVHLSRPYWSNYVLDDDNLRGALKSVRDQIANSLSIDDGDSRISWTYEQPAVSRKEAGRVLVRIEVDLE